MEIFNSVLLQHISSCILYSLFYDVPYEIILTCGGNPKCNYHILDYPERSKS